MFAIGKLLAILSAMIVVPTISYVLGETTANMGDTPPREDRSVIERQQRDGDRGKQERFFGGPNDSGDPNKNDQGENRQGGMPGGDQRQKPFGGPNGQVPFNKDINGQNNPNGKMMFFGNEGDNKNNKGMMPGFNPNQPFDKQGQNGQGNGVPGDANQGQNSSGGMMGGQNGPSDEDMEKREQEMEKRQAEQEKRQLEQMKKGLTNMKRPLAAMKLKMDQLGKSGIATPSDIKEFVSSMEQAMATIQSAQTFEDAQDAMDTIKESQQDFQDNFQTLQMASNWPKMVKQATSTMKGQEKMLANFIRQSKRKGALDISEPLGTFSQAIITLKTTLASAQEKAKTGDIEEAMSTLQDDFFGAIDDLRDTQETITTLTNLTQHLAQAPRQLKQYESQLNALKKKKINTQEADQILVQLKGKFSEVKVLAAAKPVDPDAVIVAVEESSGLIEQLEETINDLRGTVSTNDQLFQVNERSIPKFDLDTTGQ